MVRAIVDQMAALAQAPEIAQPVIARVMIEMRCRQDDAGRPHLRRLIEIGPPSFGEAVNPYRLERLARYEVHLDRKLERMLAMLFKLQELRRAANPT